jgi:hypothetical protein
MRRRAGHQVHSIPARIALLFLGASCTSPTEPPLPAGAHAFTPPPVYATWWRMTEQCAHSVRPMSRVSWVEAPPNVQLLPNEGKDIAGYYSIVSNTIVLDSAFALRGDLVRHEMLHALLRLPGHPRAAFLGECAGVVNCAEQCLTDAGPPPPQAPGAVDVQPDDLTVSLTVEPAQPSGAIDDGFFHVVVSATNPKAVPVTAMLPYPPHPTVFYCALGGPAGGVGLYIQLDDSSVVRFRAHETKIQVFDFQIGSVEGVRLVPGRYAVAGKYGEQWARDSITLVP